MINYLTLSNLYQVIVFILDVGLVALTIYFCLKIVENNTRTIQIFKGILFIFILNGLAQIIGLKTIEYFTSQFLNWGVLAVFIIFQPEIRSLLEKLGKTTVFSRMAALTNNEKEFVVEELVKASEALSKAKTGAIISIEQNQSLSDFIKTGTALNSVVSSEILGSIFQYGTPLHDGAVIIQGDRIACASAYFPPTIKDFPSSYGARHRASVGISEISDCITIVISEESGKISIARGGLLTTLNIGELKEYLSNSICLIETEEKKDGKEHKTEHRLKMNFSSRKSKKQAKGKQAKVDDRINASEVVAFNVKKNVKRGENDEEA